MIDIAYIAENTANLSGIPVRLYTNKGRSKKLFSPVVFSNDPFDKNVGALTQSKEPISFFVGDDFLHYGIVRYQDSALVVGPSLQIRQTQQGLLKIAFLNDLTGEEANEFVSAMSAIPSMPLVSFAEMLCIIYYAWSGQKLVASDVLIQPNVQENLTQSLEKEKLNQDLYGNPAGEAPHNTFLLEKEMVRDIKDGNLPSLEALFSKTLSARPGNMSADQLREAKNLFIVTATIASRAAIEGGLDVETAFTLSDAYIQRCELLNDSEQIANLQYHMIKDYAKKVHLLSGNKDYSATIVAAENYIRTHLTKRIKVEEIAKAVFLSRSHLEERFRNETGYSIAQYVMKEKIEEGKNLLAYSGEPIASIADYLGFSSQSHFQNVFRKNVGTTPRQYREKISKIS